MEFAASKEPIRSYMYTRKGLQKGKYAKRETVFVFRCTDCPEEIHLRPSDVAKVSGLCRKCADHKSAIARGQINRKRPFEALFNVFKRKTIKDGRDNSLTYEQFLAFTDQKTCHYCTEPVYWADFNLTKNGSAYNLDRKDNSAGYSSDNCVICCWKCNESKKDNYSYEEWYGMTAYFRK